MWSRLSVINGLLSWRWGHLSCRTHLFDNVSDTVCVCVVCVCVCAVCMCACDVCVCVCMLYVCAVCMCVVYVCAVCM